MERAIAPHFFQDGVVGPVIEAEDGLGDGWVVAEEGLEFGVGLEFGFAFPARFGGEGEVGGFGGVEPRGAEEDELVDALGVAEGDVEGDAGAHGNAAEVGFRNAEVVHEGDDVVSEGVEGVGGGIKAHGVAVAGHVGSDESGVLEVGEA